MKQISKAVIYKKNRLIKMYSGMTKNGIAVLYLYAYPKNFGKNFDEAEQAVAKQKTKKKKYLNLIFFLINVCVIAGILIFQISKQEDMSLTTLLNSTFSPLLFLVMIVMWLILQTGSAYRTNILIKISSGKSRPFLSFKTNAIGKYYDCITPMATGGQPFQIFYMKNRGLNAASAISVPMGKYVINLICTSIIWTVCIIIGLNTELSGSFNYIKVMCFIGWIANAALMTTILILSINQRIGKKIVIFVFKLLQKFKIVKNYEKQYNQVIKIVTDFQVTIKTFMKDSGNFVKLIISNLFNLMLSYSMAFLVYSTMVGSFDFSMYWKLFLLSVLIDIAVSFIPLPGGTGASELSFTTLFAVVFSDGAMLTWALIFWRIMTYYMYLLQGLIVMGYDNAIGNKKYLWLKKKWELEAESIDFARDKIHEFNLEKKKKTINSKLLLD